MQHTFRSDGLTFDLWLNESTQGSGLWTVARVQVSAVEAGHLTAASLRAAPFGRAIASATEAARRQGSPFVPPDELVPSAFLESRRGKGKRRPEDFARLALLYVQTPAEPRHLRVDLPKKWAERYGGAVQTWRNRVSEARKYVLPGDPERHLTEEGMDLALGTAWREHFPQDERDEALEELNNMKPGDPLWLSIDRNGGDPGATQREAREELIAWHGPNYLDEPNG